MAQRDDDDDAMTTICDEEGTRKGERTKNI